MTSLNKKYVKIELHGSDKIFLSLLFMFGNLCLAQPIKNSHSPSNPIEIGIFLSRECPISQKYIPRLNLIYLTYKDRPELLWSFVIPENLNRRQVKDFIKKFNVQFPLKTDDRHLSVTRSFRASVTPEVIIRKNTILYRGAIDNWFYALGQYRQQITEHYLIDALESILRKQDVEIKEAQAIGCPIAVNVLSSDQSPDHE